MKNVPITCRMKKTVVILISTCVFQTVSRVIPPECYKCGCCDDGKDTCLKGGLCSTCLEGYWGGKCLNKCPKDCLVCEKEPVRHGDGSWPNPVKHHICIKCVDGKYLGDADANRTCVLDCPDECVTCSSTKNCTNCYPGYYNDNGICMACNTSCTTCSSYNVCTSCVTGHYGTECDKCSIGCQKETCDIKMGTCECKTGFNGIKCDQCADTFYGESCDSKCPTDCLNQLCYRDKGYCISCISSNFTGNFCNACENGTYGNMCDLSCPTNCKNRICERNTGNCLECNVNYVGDKCDSCEHGKYGVGCTENCPRSCKNQRCTDEEGDCIDCSARFTGKKCDQCEAGYYSDNCSLPCLSLLCFQNKCDRHSGKCSPIEQDLLGELCNTSFKYGHCATGNSTCFNGGATSPETAKLLAIAVLATCITSVFISLAVHFMVRRVRRRLVAKNVYRRLDRNWDETIVEPGETLKNKQTSQISDYEMIQDERSIYEDKNSTYDGRKVNYEDQSSNYEGSSSIYEDTKSIYAITNI